MTSSPDLSTHRRHRVGVSMDGQIQPLDGPVDRYLPLADSIRLETLASCAPRAQTDALEGVEARENAELHRRSSAARS